MPRWLTLLLLTLIVALAATVRIAWIGHYSYFFDEAWNDELSTGRGSLHIQLANNSIHESVPRPTSLVGAPPWWKVWTNIDHVTHPPPYLIVLRWWRAAFGESDIVSRSCSAVLSALAILLLFDVGRLLHGTTTALWASLIMALAGAQILLAQEVRPYALMLLVSLATLSAIVRIEKLGPSLSRNIALGVCVLAMVMTHYFAAPAALAIGVYVLIRFRGKARRDAIVALIVAASVFAIIWGPSFLKQRSYFSAAANMWLREDPNGHVTRTFWRLGQVPLRLLIQPPRHTFPLGYIAAGILIIPFLLVRRRPEMLLWCVWLSGTIFTIAAMDLLHSTQQLGYIRYSLLGSPAVYMTLAALLEQAKRRWIAHIVPASIAVACACALPEAYAEFKPDFRLLARYIDDNIQPNDAIVFYSAEPQGWLSNAMYLNTACYTRTQGWAFAMMTHPPDDRMIQRLRQFHAVWLVNRSREMSGTALIPNGSVDGFQYFPFVGTCERISPKQRE